MKTTGTTTTEEVKPTFGNIEERAALAKELQGTGDYFLIPPPSLVQKAEYFYDLHADDIRNLLQSSGTSEEVAEMVLNDYAALLTGSTEYKLRLNEQDYIFNKFGRAARVFVTEGKALPLLFDHYHYFMWISKFYLDKFRNADGHEKKVVIKYRDGEKERTEETIEVTVEEQKQNFLRVQTDRILSGYCPTFARSFDFLNKTEKLLSPDDFAGVPPELGNRFFAAVKGGVAADVYRDYFYIAKHILKASREELLQIPFPPFLDNVERAISFAEPFADGENEKWQKVAREYGKLLTAETPEQFEKVKTEIELAQPEKRNVEIPETFALLGSRDMFASGSGTKKLTNGILPITAIINDKKERLNFSENVTDLVLLKAVEGINLLSTIKNVQPVAGKYIIETNISEFAQVAGYGDAFQDTKMELLRALQVLDGLYLIVWRADGLHAVRVFTLREIGISGKATGKLIFEVYAEARKGHKTLITAQDYQEMRKNAKGQAQTHFRNQIIAKGHIKEDDLLDQVFGYSAYLQKMEFSGASPEEIEKARRNSQKNKTRDRKRLLDWFETYKSKGWIVEYSRTKNSKGEYIYKWRRGNQPPATEKEEEKASIPEKTGTS